MKEIWVLCSRAIRLYLKNPLALLFSFVYMLLFLALFALFLGDYMAKGMANVYRDVQGIQLSHMRWLVDSTAMAGVLMINCILVPLNVLTLLVSDRCNRHLDSFLISAASPNRLVLGYWLAPFLTGVAMNTLCLFLIQIYLVANGGLWLSTSQNLAMFVQIILNTFTSVSIFFVVAMLIRDVNLYSTITGIVSALVGFITGAFLPIGIFPAAVQVLLAAIPAHHGATMMRQIMSEPALTAVFGTVTDQTVNGNFMTAVEIIDIYCRENGITYFIYQMEVPAAAMFLVVVCFGIVFLLLGIGQMKRYQQVR